MDERTSPVRDEIAQRIGLGQAPAQRKRLWLGVTLALIALGALALWIFRPSPVQFVTGTVTQGPLTVIVSATGTLKPLNQVDVGAEISGRIVSISADFNDHVTKGQVLAELDTQELKAKVVQSEANIANARATLAETRAKRDRMVALGRTGISSKENLDIAQASYERAEAAVKQAQALLDVDRTNLSRAEIRAPIDGIVLDRKVEAGQTVASVFQTPVLFTLAEDLKRMRLIVDVDEADVGRVKNGQAATFTVDAYFGRRFSATVQEFRNAPHTNEGVVTYEAVLTVDNADLALRPGMTANADIVSSTLKDARLIPNGALRFTPPGVTLIKDGTGTPPRVKVERAPRLDEAPPSADLGAGYAVAWTLEGPKPVPHVIRVGASDGLNSVIETGDLRPGQKILIDVVRRDDKRPGPP